MIKSIRNTLLFALATCNPMVARAVDNTAAPSEKIKQGLENVKEGTQEAAKDFDSAAQKVAKSAGEATKKVGRSLKAATCRIVGDRKTKLYYAADSKNYETVLDGQKFFEDDDRDCFMTEQAAREGGYTRSAD